MQTKTCQNCTQDFVIDQNDQDFYAKIQVPWPTFCPICRLQRRFAWRNERSLYYRECDNCSQKIISVFSPDKQLTVYCPSCWWGDSWDGLEYGVPYDPTRSFFEQVRGLFANVPVMSLFGLHSSMQNSPYINMASYVKDCYLCTYIDFSENCLFSSFVLHSKDSLDCLMLQNSELCYECVNCHKCSRTFYSLDCEDSYDIWYSRNLVGCSNCFGCVNLRNKNYYIFNEPYSKEEYEKKIKEIKDENPKKLWYTLPQKYIHASHIVDSTGEYLYHTKNVKNSYLVSKAEDSRYCAFADNMKDSMDFSNYGDASGLLYESLQCGAECSKISFSWWACINNLDIAYSMFVIGSKDLFGCVGLKKKSYCILNKQYSKEDYFALKQKIIDDMKEEGEYGEFFPVHLSPFSYNETSAQEFFPLTKVQVLGRGFNWKEKIVRDHKATLDVAAVPNSIQDVTDSILTETICCSNNAKELLSCTGAFRITEAELLFYRKMNISIPKFCPNCRLEERLKQRQPIALYARNCACLNEKHQQHFGVSCNAAFETSYTPDCPEKIYCEKCYQSETI